LALVALVQRPSTVLLANKAAILSLVQLRQQVVAAGHQALLWPVVTAVQAAVERSAAVRLAEMERLGKAITAAQRQ
jgi:hypothetical protein